MTLVDPATVDWRAMDDAAVWHAAQSGIPQAQDELRRHEAERRLIEDRG